MVYGVSTPEELTKYILETNSKIVFTLDMFQDKFKSISAPCNIEKIIVANVTESMSAFNRFGARVFKKIKPLPLPKDNVFISWNDFIKKSNGNSKTTHNPNAISIITYTGGTTGGSKGVALSNKAVIAVAEQYIIGEKELIINDIACRFSASCGAYKKAETFVEIVRCKDCKHWGRYEPTSVSGRCRFECKMRMEDDFCSYGERKDNEK
jgi:acyl-coenzyme A synthetase/AMP-(fatty) acid ligase